MPASLIALALGCVMNCSCTNVPLPQSYVMTASDTCDPALIVDFLARCIAHCQEASDGG